MEDSQIIHEFIMIMNDNQYSGGRTQDSNKTTVTRLHELLDKVGKRTNGNNR